MKTIAKFGLMIVLAGSLFTSCTVQGGYWVRERPVEPVYERPWHLITMPYGSGENGNGAVAIMCTYVATMSTVAKGTNGFRATGTIRHVVMPGNAGTGDNILVAVSSCSSSRLFSICCYCNYILLLPFTSAPVHQYPTSTYFY